MESEGEAVFGKSLEEYLSSSHNFYRICRKTVRKCVRHEEWEDFMHDSVLKIIEKGYLFPTQNHAIKCVVLSSTRILLDKKKCKTTLVPESSYTVSTPNYKFIVEDSPGDSTTTFKPQLDKQDVSLVDNYDNSEILDYLESQCETLEWETLLYYIDTGKNMPKSVLQTLEKVQKLTKNLLP